MSDRPRKTTAPASSQLSIPLIMLAAFALGAGTTWLAMRGTTATPPGPAIENFIPPPLAQVPGLSQFTPPVTEEPPDVSRLAPADAERTLANWNYDRQNWSHAIEHYEAAIARGADTPDVRTDLGNCFRFLGQPQKALEQYKIAQKQNPQHENSLFNQISLFADLLHDKERALVVGQEFMTRFPQSPRAATAQELIEKLQSAPTENK
jgi:tetratricopeptide (TPR) repeat protein